MLRAPVSVMIATALCGCIADLDVPSDTLIACETSKQCPAGYQCNAALSRCLLTNRDQAVPAIVGQATIAPNPTNTERPTEVRFTVSTTLADVPEVTLDDPSKSALDFVSRDGHEYVFELPAQRGQHGLWVVSAMLVGENGALSPNLALGTLEIDLVPPGLAAPVAVTPWVIGPEGAILSISSNEDLPSAPTLFVTWEDAGGVAHEESATLLTSAGPRSFEFTYNVVGDEPSRGAGVRLQLEDLAGNEAEIIRQGLLQFDLQGPLPLDGTTTLQLLPPANGLPVVQSVATGTTVRLVLIFDEPIEASAGLPMVRTVGTEMEFTCNPAGTALICSLLLSEGAGPLADGAYAQGRESLEIFVQDSLGNSSHTTLPEPWKFDVDTVPPAAADVLTPEAIIFRRHPWGDETGQTKFSVEGRAGAAEAGAMVRVLSNGAVLSEPLAASDGSFGPVELHMTDRDTVELMVVDSGGNNSPAVDVLDVVWTASLQGKSPGDSFFNPHSFSARPILDHRLIVSMPAEREFGQGAGLAEANELGVYTLGGATFDVLNDNLYLPQRGMAAAAWDSARARTLIVGGVQYSGSMTTGPIESPLDDSWVRERTRWRQLPLLNNERPGQFQSLAGVGRLAAYDPNSHMLLVAPRADEPSWMLDGDQWKSIPQEVALPSGPRAVTYDPRRQAVVMVVAAAPIQVFAWTGVGWSEVCGADCATGSVPDPTGDFAISYDEARAQLLLVHGGETWVWPDGAAWQQKCVTGACAAEPVSRYHFTMAYDQARGETLLYGGCGVEGTSCAASYFDLWRWDGADWVCAITEAQCEGFSCTGPLPLCNVTFDTEYQAWPSFGGNVVTGVPTNGHGAALVYDPMGERMILVGGQSGLSGGSYAQQAFTWEWDGDAWQQVTNSGTPRRLDGVAASFGGSEPGVLYFVAGDTWVWDGRTWQQTCTGACPKPSSLSGGAMASDPLTDSVLFYGGNDGSSGTGTDLCALWQWTRQTQWQELWPQGVCPGDGSGPLPKHESRLTHAPGLGGFFLDDGAPWLWQSNSWSCLQAPCAATVSGIPGAVAWDPQQGAVVKVGGEAMMGGGVAAAQAWVANAWSPLTPLPAGRGNHTLVLDPSRNLLSLFGGLDSIQGSCPACLPSCDPLWGVCDDLFTFDGGAWVSPTTYVEDHTGIPAGRYDHAAAYDPVNRGTLIYGGQDGTGSTNYFWGTWLWRSGAHTRPGHLFSADAQRADQGTIAVTEFAVKWIGGAVGYPGGVETAGVRLNIWDRDRWRPTNSANAASPAAPSSILWSSRQDPLWQGLGSEELTRILSSQRTLHIAASPVAPNGQAPDLGEMFTDYVEVSVHYRRR